MSKPEINHVLSNPLNWGLDVQNPIFDSKKWALCPRFWFSLPRPSVEGDQDTSGKSMLKKQPSNLKDSKFKLLGIFNILKFDIKNDLFCVLQKKNINFIPEIYL